ncbi:hypothetical protein EV356DRAFT_516952 [Viridothelium virens]|uniref:Protein kinase domain-containing protein n=1 Tax=Viridothelium virens TaxID=1048519 RepID=A0A6A6H5C2_VIRVR|nr:hypothetical protein EV356DRAFT_516952 [Viridothelium virens]
MLAPAPAVGVHFTPQPALNESQLAKQVGRVIVYPNPDESSALFKDRFSQGNEAILKFMWKQSAYRQVAVPSSRDFVPYIEIGYAASADIRIPTRAELEEALDAYSNQTNSSQRQESAPSSSSRSDTSSNSDNMEVDEDFLSDSQMCLEEHCPDMTIRVYPDSNSGAAVVHNLSGSRVGFLCSTDPHVNPVLNTGEFARLPNEAQDSMEFDIITGNGLLRLQILRPPDILCTQPSGSSNQELQIQERTMTRPLIAQLYLKAAPGQEAHFPTTGDIAGYSLIWMDRLRFPIKNISVISIVKDPAANFFLSQTIDTRMSGPMDLVVASTKFADQRRINGLLFRNPCLMKAMAFDPRTLTTLYDHEECRSLTEPQFLRRHGYTNLEEQDVLQVLAGVATLLQDMHHIGLVHGLIEPANIFYSRSKRRVKVMSLMNVASSNDFFTYGGMIGCVLAWYLAPEEVDGGKRTREGDIFALGVTGLFLMGVMPLPEINSGQFHIQALTLQEPQRGTRGAVEEMWKWLDRAAWGGECVPAEEGSLRALLSEMVSKEAWMRPSARRVKEFVDGMGAIA